jgi:phosphate:Na+ symporter
MEVFSINWWGNLVGGLGVFIFSIVLMGDSLKKLAGNNLKTIIDKYTTNPIRGVLVGITATVLIQSSSGTTALAISLIRAGFMTLAQAIGIIMGANIGTTITAFLIGLRLTTYSPFILIIGAIFYIVASKSRLKRLGEAIFGFGGLFFGLSLMEGALKPLAKLPEFISIVQDLGQLPFLGILIGVAGTVIVQSSSAFIGILQGLYSASSDSNFTLAVAIPILFGSNIGTTITAILAAIGTSIPAKRTALAHVIFNVFGTLLFMLFLGQYTAFITLISNQFALDSRMQIAVAHIIFNITTTLILLPLISQLVKFVTYIFPEKSTIQINKTDLSDLDTNILNIAPATALNIAKKQVLEMSKLASQSVGFIIDYVENKNISARDAVITIEKTIDDFDIHLTKFMNKIEHFNLEPKEIITYTEILKIFKDIERISDHCENLIEFFDEYYDRNETIFPDTKKDITIILKLANEMLRLTVISLSTPGRVGLSDINSQEALMDQMQKDIRARHIARIMDGKVNATQFISMVLVDIISNIERIGDHCVNIVETIEQKLPVHPQYAKKN